MISWLMNSSPYFLICPHSTTCPSFSMTWRIFFPELCKISPVNHLTIRGCNIIMKKLKKDLTQDNSYFANSFAWPTEFGGFVGVLRIHQSWGLQVLVGIMGRVSYCGKRPKSEQTSCVAGEMVIFETQTPFLSQPNHNLNLT